MGSQGRSFPSPEFLTALAVVPEVVGTDVKAFASYHSYPPKPPSKTDCHATSYIVPLSAFWSCFSLRASCMHPCMVPASRPTTDETTTLSSPPHPRDAIRDAAITHGPICGRTRTKKYKLKEARPFVGQYEKSKHNALRYVGMHSSK